MNEVALSLREKAERYRRVMKEAEDQRLREAAKALALELDRKAAEVDRLAMVLRHGVTDPDGRS